ncbi:MAG: cupin-like domain-containing protein [Chitinophagaceae bacterium]|nr:cupin-like domain-containing protein [Chitinophagaceae bacterium]MBL0306568.1 cupin-like domain-containing protein [Chitinophagaceae bacterium]HQV60767.1 cupin-like domain-containing protein [Chitinophagaceae bacterium]HQV86766.1 cupin-like domain-containing protein [Chitinophagaceae bacterium]HQZ73382.1 cupin-like domain-containing protein [Chitinophagaceae bacterium]
MQLKPVAVFDSIDPEVFKKEYYEPCLPVVIKNLAKDWPAYSKWNWDYFKQLVGQKKVPLYNNVKSDAYTPINTADDYKTFGEYIDMISSGPAAWRIFLFNIFDHAPQLINDFTWPEHLMKGFVKKYPMLFTGGASSITHMHFDIDMSHILHTQFCGRKRVLMFPYQEQYKLYRKPWEVLSLADFSNYYIDGKVDYEKFPALKLAEGHDFILEPGDTLFMPAGYWHHMEYLDSGFAMSLRALQPSVTGKLRGAWNLFGMRSIDTVMKKTVPKWWYERKEKRVFENAARVLASN